MHRQFFASFLLFLLLPFSNFNYLIAEAAFDSGHYYCYQNEIWQRGATEQEDRRVTKCRDDQFCDTTSADNIECLNTCEYVQPGENGKNTVCKGEFLPSADGSLTCQYSDRVGVACGLPQNASTVTDTTPKGLGEPPAGLTQIENVFKRVLGASVGLAFVAMFVVLVIAGIRFLTSGGEPKAVASAKEAIAWALLGVLFLAIGWLILQLIAAVTGIDALKTFDIKVLTR